MTYRIYRLKEAKGNDYYRFMGSKKLELYNFWPPKPDAYEQIWEGPVHGFDPNNILERIFAKFNLDKPMLFHHYSMSVGDIVVLNGEKAGAYFCDSIGWTDLPEFFENLPPAE